MEFLTEYGLFLAKTATIVVAVGIVVALVVSAGIKHQHMEKGHLEVTKINQKFEELANAVSSMVLPQEAFKAHAKERKKQEKDEKKKLKQALKHQDKEKEDETPGKKRVFVADFDGDIKASATAELREVVTAILSVAKESDEVVLRLESQGGMVHSYGLAASQLRRITSNNIPLTVCVDKVAASGGYMMACVANKIVSAPFAIIGSIGVVAQLPNFHRLLKKHDVDYELLTAGEYKRTLTIFGENTEKGRDKFMEDLEDTHVLFKDFISQNRAHVDIEAVATGEIWFGTRALEKNLVDALETSDQYLYALKDESDIYQVKYVQKRSIAERVGINLEDSLDRLITRWLQRFNGRFF